MHYPLHKPDPSKDGGFRPREGVYCIQTTMKFIPRHLLVFVPVRGCIAFAAYTGGFAEKAGFRPREGVYCIQILANNTDTAFNVFVPVRGCIAF